MSCATRCEPVSKIRLQLCLNVVELMDHRGKPGIGVFDVLTYGVKILNSSSSPCACPPYMQKGKDERRIYRRIGCTVFEKRVLIMIEDLNTGNGISGSEGKGARETTGSLQNRS
jgi:hypothetical protein